MEDILEIVFVLQKESDAVGVSIYFFQSVGDIQDADPLLCQAVNDLQQPVAF